MAVIIFECWGVVFTSRIYLSEIIATLQRAPVRLSGKQKLQQQQQQQKLESSGDVATVTEYVNLGIDMYQVLLRNEMAKISKSITQTKETVKMSGLWFQLERKVLTRGLRLDR